MKSIRFIVDFATCMLLLIQATAQQVTIAEAEKVAASVMNYENVDTVLIDTVFAMVENGDQSNVLVGLDSRDDNCYHELTLKYGAFHCNGAGGGNDY